MSILQAIEQCVLSMVGKVRGWAGGRRVSWRQRASAALRGGRPTLGLSRRYSTSVITSSFFLVCLFLLGSFWDKISPKQWEDKWEQAADEVKKNRFLSEGSWGLLESVAAASFHRSSLWGRRGKWERKMCWPELLAPGWKHYPESISPLFWPKRPLLLLLLLLLARFAPAMMMSCKSFTAI